MNNFNNNSKDTRFLGKNKNFNILAFVGCLLLAFVIWTYVTNVKISDNKKTITIKKATAKLTAKNKAFKAKVKTKKYTITLKSDSGKALKNAKVTLKVKGKTYKATTNAKGKATFKITKLTKKGKYSATVKFASDGCYKAVSKSVKITVKK